MKACAPESFVSIPTGTFEMGTSLEEIEACVAVWAQRLVDPAYDEASFRQWLLKELPKHPVQVAAFRLGRFPVTNGEYRDFVQATGRRATESILSGEPGNHPVWGVSPEEAQTYAAWLSARLGIRCRLPTEAEWEYAARGPSGREYPFGDSFDPACCNTIESGIGRTTPVDCYSNGVSELGVFDLAGNVEEWTADVYAPYPGGVFIHDDLSRSNGPRYRVLRGGSCARGGDLARCARRHGPFPGPEFRYRGFRIAVDEGT
jgi:formylglycine-generating enzyme required for sulfatase activity